MHEESGEGRPRRGRRRAPAFEPAPGTDTGAPDEEGLPRDRPRGVLRRMLSGFLSYGVVILVFAFLIPKLRQADISSVLSLITPWQVAVITVLGVVNLATNLPPIVITLEGLRFREAAVTNTASAALSNTVPEGGAVATGLNFAMLRSWGFELGPITSSFLTTGIWTNLCRYGLVAVALVLMVVSEGAETVLVAVSLGLAALVAAAVAALIALLRSERFARWLGRFGERLINPVIRRLHRPELTDLEDRLTTFRLELLELVRDRWHTLTAAMLVSQLATCVVLAAAVRMQGLGPDVIGWPRIVVAYGAAALVSLIFPVPGGLGVAEAALISVLGANLGEQYSDQVVAAVVLYRYATWLLPVPIGAGTYLFWRRNTSWRRPPRSGSAADPAVDPLPA